MQSMHIYEKNIMQMVEYYKQAVEFRSDYPPQIQPDEEVNAIQGTAITESLLKVLRAAKKLENYMVAVGANQGKDDPDEATEEHFEKLEEEVTEKSLKSNELYRGIAQEAGMEVEIDDDDDIVDSTQSVQTKCPLTLEPMIIPARTRCGHLFECKALKDFVGKSAKKCPYGGCGKNIEPGSWTVDKALQKRLARMARNTQIDEETGEVNANVEEL